MALGSTQPLTEMSTRNLLGDKGWPAPKADNLTAICEPTVASMSCYRDIFTRGEFLNSEAKKMWSFTPTISIRAYSVVLVHTSELIYFLPRPHEMY
jgi:hypothetical protein